ncbi:MAG TPA: nucleoside triphosphate pyrophosphohydrolase [Acidimicrobiia bacterium]
MIVVTGLGPGDLDRVPGPIRDILLDPQRTVVVRTRHHPAAEQLARARKVIFCDDLYESADAFDDVYTAVADRVLAAATSGPVVYAVPGSPMVGEFAVRRLLASDADIELIPAESFVDAVLAEVGYDPLDRGLQILNGHHLPEPLVLDKPTIIAHLDRSEILAEVAAQVDRVLPEGTVVNVYAGLGSADALSAKTIPSEVDSSLAGYRTSMYIDAEPGGLIGAVHTMMRLREECPWDREQTHQTLMKNLVEESYELIEAVGRLPEGDPDWVAYAAVEDELGDVLLQVLFHAVIARQAGAFNIDDVAEVMRQKLVRRHPHVFGDVEVGSAEEVKSNWDRIKEEERGSARESALDGVPSGVPALQRASKIQNRAAKVGFDWDEALQVLPKVREELGELEEVLGDPTRAREELGDVLFSVVNLARHLGLDPEIALGQATDRFEARFRRMEAEGPLDGLDLDGLNERWEQSKEED